MSQIFISYSRKDIGFVRKLAGDLEKAGYDVWWDLTDLRGGDDWPRVIPAAIAASQAMIIVLSPNSAVSDWVEKEYTQALSLRKKIIPIMLKRSSVPFALNTINYVDFTSDDYVGSFNHLLTALGYTGDPPVVVPTATLAMLLRKYAVPIAIGILILLAVLARFAFTPPPPATTTSTPAVLPTTPFVTFTDPATVSPTISSTVTLTPTLTETSTPGPTFTSSPTRETFPTLRFCVNSPYAHSINVRSGPGTIYAPLGEPLLVDECLNFSARNEEGTWLQIASNQPRPALEQYVGGWIFRELLGPIDPTDLRAVTLTPTPTPSDTPTITPTFTRTATPVPSDTPTITPTFTHTPTDTPVPPDTETPTPTPTETPTPP
ncbi:MAG: toll/interleukin-1 receptor domain-containing protein [Chloroflexi bacterium]|nr:MAG: toll/interleukin-1 receptor domain-containing protein [Chloroflexota bacterium]